MNSETLNIKSYNNLLNSFDFEYDDTNQKLYYTNTFNYIKILSSLKNLKKKDDIILDNNIILYIGLMDDGTGDYNWIRQYINIFLDFGYTTKQIYIIGIYLDAYQKFNYDDNKLSIKFDTISLINVIQNEQLKNKLQSGFNLTDTNGYFVTNLNLVEESDEILRMLTIEINNSTKKEDKEILQNFANKYIKWFRTLKNESFHENVDFKLSNLAFEDKFFEKKGNDCSLSSFNYLNNSIIISFYNKKLKILSKCKNIKYISMSEGVAALETKYLSSVITSGIGFNRLGLQLTNFNTINKSTIITTLNTFCNPDDTFTSSSKYHIAYISSHQPHLLENHLKFQYLLLNSINSVVYLFVYESIKQFQNYMDRINLFFKLLEIDITRNDNGYDIKLNQNIIKVRYFNRMNKDTYLSTVLYSESPVYTTGDLSAQEAMMLQKYIIHDYVGHKKPFMNQFMEFMVSYDKSNIMYNNLEEIKKYTEFMSAFYIYYDDLNFCKYVNNTLYPFIPYKHGYPSYYKCIYRLKYNITKLVSSFVEYKLLYDDFYLNIISKIFVFKNNFKSLLALVYSFDDFSLSLPTFENDSIISFTQFENFSEYIKKKKVQQGGVKIKYKLIK